MKWFKSKKTSDYSAGFNNGVDAVLDMIETVQPTTKKAKKEWEETRNLISVSLKR